MSTQHSDVYGFHQAALAQLLETKVPGKTYTQTDLHFISLVIEQGVGPARDLAIEQGQYKPPPSNRERELIHQSHLTATATYLAQSRGLKEIRTILKRLQPPHAIFSGFQVGEGLYTEPAIRRAGRIDLLLVNPVFTKYPTTDRAALLRQLDLFLLLDRGAFHWPSVADWVDSASLKATAWLSMALQISLMQLAEPPGFLNELAPRKPQNKYLISWLKPGMPNSFKVTPRLVQAGL